MCGIPQEIDTSNADHLIGLIVDNNFEAVRSNLSKVGLNIGGLTPCLVKQKLKDLMNNGVNIYPIIDVPYNPSARNYTNEFMSSPDHKLSWGSIKDFFSNLGTTVGGYVGNAAQGFAGSFLGGNQQGNNIPPPSKPETDYIPYLIGLGGLFVVVILIILLKK